MPNLDFKVTRSPAEVEVRIKAMRTKIAGEISDIVAEAARLGADEARALAPRSGIFRNEGRRISDSIQYEDSRFSAGGAGGGGSYRARFYASSTIAPQLSYVLEGTGGQGNIIRPTRGNVLALQKEGEGVHFRRWVHGQDPQTAWWEAAHEVAERFVAERIHDISIPD
jgi:hypothetical protein